MANLTVGYKALLWQLGYKALLWPLQGWLGDRSKITIYIKTHDYNNNITTKKTQEYNNNITIAIT